MHIVSCSAARVSSLILNLHLHPNVSPSNLFFPSYAVVQPELIARRCNATKGRWMVAILRLIHVAATRESPLRIATPSLRGCPSPRLLNSVLLPFGKRRLHSNSLSVRYFPESDPLQDRPCLQRDGPMIRLRCVDLRAKILITTN